MHYKRDEPYAEIFFLVLAIFCTILYIATRGGH